MSKKNYSANLTQTGTDAPVEVRTNGSASLTWQRGQAGSYFALLPSNLDITKISVMCGQTSAQGKIVAFPVSAEGIGIIVESYLWDEGEYVLSDDVLLNTPILIDFNQ